MQQGFISINFCIDVRISLMLKYQR